MAQRGALFSEDDIESASSELAGDARIIGIRRPDEVIHPGDDFETNSKYFLRIKSEQKAKRDSEVKRKRDEAEKARKEEERYKAAVIEAEVRAKKEEYRRRKVELDALKEVKQRQKDNDAKARREEYLRKKIVDGKAQREMEDQSLSDSCDNARVDLQERKRIDDQRAEERMAQNERFFTEKDDTEGHILVTNEEKKESGYHFLMSPQETVDGPLEENQTVSAEVESVQENQTKTHESHPNEGLQVVEEGSIDAPQEQREKEQSEESKKGVVDGEENIFLKPCREEKESEINSARDNETILCKNSDERKDKAKFDERKEKRVHESEKKETSSHRDDSYESCDDEDTPSGTRNDKLKQTQELHDTTEKDLDNPEKCSDDEHDWDEERGVFIPKKNPIQHRTETADTCCHHRGFKCCRIISLIILLLIVPLIYSTLVIVEYSTHGWERFAVRTSSPETNDPDSKSKYSYSNYSQFELVQRIQLHDETEEKLSSPTFNDDWRNQTFSVYVKRNPLTWEMPLIGFFLGLVANIVPMASGLILFLVFHELRVPQQSHDSIALCSLLQAVNNGILGFISWCARDVRFFIFRALLIIVPFAWAGYFVGITRHFTLKDMCRSAFGETRELDILQTYLRLAFGLFMILISIFVIIGACIGGMNRYCCPSYSGGTTPGCKSFCQWILVLVFAFFTGWMFLANIGAGMGVLTFVTLSIFLGVETKRALPTSIVVSGWTQLLPVLINYVMFNEFPYIYLLVVFPGMWIGSIFAPWLSRLWGPTVDLIFYFCVLMACGSAIIIAASMIQLSDMEDISINNITSGLLPFAHSIQSSWSSESIVAPATSLPQIICADAAIYCALTTQYCSQSFCPTCHLSHMCDLTCFNCEFSTTSKNAGDEKSVENSNYVSKEERGAPEHYNSLSKSDGEPSCPDTEPFCPALSHYCEESFCPTCLNAHVCDFTCGFDCTATTAPIASPTTWSHATALIQNDQGATTAIKQKLQKIPTPAPAIQVSPEPTLFAFPDVIKVSNGPTNAPISQRDERKKYSQTLAVSPPPSVTKLKGKHKPTSAPVGETKEIENQSLMPTSSPLLDHLKLAQKHRPTPGPVAKIKFKRRKSNSPSLAPSPYPSAAKLKGKHMPTPAPIAKGKVKIELPRSTNSPMSGPTNIPTLTVVSEITHQKPTSAPKLKKTNEPTLVPVAPSSAPSYAVDIKMKKLHPSNNAPLSSPPTSTPTFIYYAPVNEPTSTPTEALTGIPILTPSCRPSPVPLWTHTFSPVSLKADLTKVPHASPTHMPTTLQQPSYFPSDRPSLKPISSDADPVMFQLYSPTHVPRSPPTIIPIPIPSSSPLRVPTKHPSLKPISAPSADSTAFPLSSPTYVPISIPTTIPRSVPTISPLPVPTNLPSSMPHQPSHFPSLKPVSAPSADPTTFPSSLPTYVPMPEPTTIPFPAPSLSPLPVPTSLPSSMPHQPSHFPSLKPMASPSAAPSQVPLPFPTYLPSVAPTASPSHTPSSAPTFQPSELPSGAPSLSPSFYPTMEPTSFPSSAPSPSTTHFPTITPPPVDPLATFKTLIPVIGVCLSMIIGIAIGLPLGRYIERFSQKLERRRKEMFENANSAIPNNSFSEDDSASDYAEDTPDLSRNRVLR